MQYRLSSILVFLLYFSLAVSALSLSAPSAVSVRETETRFFATIENTSGTENLLTVSYSAPVQYRLIDVPSTIAGNNSATIEIVLLPNSELAGTVYASTLTAKLGNETASRQVNIAFEGARKPSAAGFFSLASLLSAENALNIALVIIAAILLIAFIARFTKRVSAK